MKEHQATLALQLPLQAPPFPPAPNIAALLGHSQGTRLIYHSISRVGLSQPHPGGAAGTGTARGAQVPVWGALHEHGTTT